ncbi:pyridoxine/pyridoxamine 5'-phosphate oxidase [Baekduia sp. Peel2402]|uniref:pyridoxine/pyridoxamine 5'-phosphate oxidase n=1 Tax=Baekduia sp. Peel2402 TaxID=3458296 RepID=UPI00403E99A1
MTAPSHDLAARLRALPVFDLALPAFDPSGAPDDPALLFAEWLEEAIDHGVAEPHAMTISTIGTDGRPNARVLILKGIADGHWRFASSGLSVKGRELAATAAAALTFYWPARGRQIRVRGAVVAAEADVSAQDFLARGPAARAEALLARQSQPLVGELPELEVPPADLVAEHWTVYEVVADEVEFWQADAERRHVRLRYLREADGAGWTTERLWP